MESSPSDKWHLRFMEVARQVSGWSKDRSRGVGTVIVSPWRDIRATGYNGFPRGIDDEVPERHERPTKYLFTEHAERNAIYAAARLGFALEGCSLYTTLFPCVDCARAVIQSGIATVITPKPDFDDPKWGADFLVAELLLTESGVTIQYIEEL